MSNRTKSELERYVDGSSKDRLDIKAMVKEYFISERCSEILKLVVDFIETIPELSHDTARLKYIKDFSKNFSKSKTVLVEIMSTKLVSYGGKYFKDVVFEEFVRIFNKTELVKDKLCFEKDAILFVEGCNIFNFEEDVKKKDLSSLKPADVYKLGVLCGISGGFFEFLENFLTGKRLEFYERARRSAVMVEQHGTSDLYEKAKVLARKIWKEGSLFNNKKMAYHIVQNYPEFASLKGESLSDKLKDVGDEFKLTKGRPGYRAKEAIEMPPRECPKNCVNHPG